MRLVNLDDCDRKLFYKQFGGKDNFITLEGAFDMLMALPVVAESRESEIYNKEKTDLWEIYYGIENLLNELSEFDSYSPYQETLSKLENRIEMLYKYFGVRKLKMNVGELKTGEVVRIEECEAGVYLIPLIADKRNIVVDLYDYMDISPEDMFYE